VEIDGEYYLDGGIMSNTPLQYVAQDFRMDALIVAVDLFSGRGDLPCNLNQVQERVKDIQFQSKTRLTHEHVRQVEALRSDLAYLIDRLPAHLRNDPRIEKLEQVSRRGPLTLVHLVNRHDTQSADFKDYEFSRATVNELWQGGHDDTQQVLVHPQDCRIGDLGNSVHVIELPT
jgi:NTE family protein